MHLDLAETLSAPPGTLGLVGTEEINRDRPDCNFGNGWMVAFGCDAPREVLGWPGALTKAVPAVSSSIPSPVLTAFS